MKYQYQTLPEMPFTERDEPLSDYNKIGIQNPTENARIIISWI